VGAGEATRQIACPLCVTSKRRSHESSICLQWPSSNWRAPAPPRDLAAKLLSNRLLVAGGTGGGTDGAIPECIHTGSDPGRRWWELRRPGAL
jgi:hypothetical protein